MSACKKMEILMSRRIDNDLDKKMLTELSHHIKTCPVCAAVEKRMNDSHSMVKDAKPSIHTLPDTNSIEVLLSKGNRYHSRLRQFPVFNFKYGIAALLVACIGVSLFLNSQKTKTVSNAELQLSARMIGQTDVEESLNETIVEVNVPLAVLDYYMSMDEEANVLLQYSTINENPLSSYDLYNETIGTDIYIRPIYSDEPLEKQHFDFIM